MRSQSNLPPTINRQPFRFYGQKSSPFLKWSKSRPQRFPFRIYTFQPKFRSIESHKPQFVFPIGTIDIDLVRPPETPARVDMSSSEKAELQKTELSEKGDMLKRISASKRKQIQSDELYSPYKRRDPKMKKIMKTIKKERAELLRV